MVTMDKIQAGLTAFVDREIAPSLSGWDKVIVSGGLALMAANLPNIISAHASHPAVAALGVYDAQINSIDIDAVYNAVCQYIGTERMPVSIPVVGLTVKIGRPEVDALYRYIKGA